MPRVGGGMILSLFDFITFEGLKIIVEYSLPNRRPKFRARLQIFPFVCSQFGKRKANTDVCPLKGGIYPRERFSCYVLMLEICIPIIRGIGFSNLMTVAKLFDPLKGFFDWDFRLTFLMGYLLWCCGN